MKKHFFKIFLFLIFILAFTQNDEKYVYYGNKLMRLKQYPQAALLFQKALKENPNNTAARYNLGNALFRQARDLKLDSTKNLPIPAQIPKDSLVRMLLQEAVSYYEPITQRISNKDTLQKTWHNIGNAHLWKEDYNAAIEAYKKALKINPKDEYTRYNLAYALKKRKDQSGGGGGKSNQQQNQKQQQQNQQQEMDKQEADRILRAIMQAEQKLHDKNKHQKDPKSANPEKDW
ncbi:MAG: tetratricopeptide repeat protein [Bacteroidia bacterium]|nr:tetratricopeptide repeat protein [Bacteroidia bacterium]